ncbi:hypothetical protein [Alistipes onderdonkii]|uniref:hypothetical protein n=1 Tax=Alistipes onderdonkii TaxID=328813 RepID=UPI0011436178|nr:hypothetical protein [Alistipes onderdonkii]
MQQTTITWHERAIAYLRRHTCAMRDIIERFVELFWDRDISDEENLLAFENYEAELQSAYSF